jgi:hypothetical protein
MAAGSNIKLPDDLLAQIRAIAATEGKTADDLAAEAVKREVARRLIADLKRTARPSGMTEDQEMQAAVDAVHDYRRAG